MKCISKPKVFCNSCSLPLDQELKDAAEGRIPCPKCGSIQRRVELIIEETLIAREKIMIKAKTLGTRRPVFELTRGDDLNRTTGRWMRLERIIDRFKNLYKEKVIDPETGETVHSCSEPLSDHQNHGSAKRKKK